MEMKPISSMVKYDEDEAEIRERLKDVDQNTAKHIIKDLIKRGKSAERSLAYQSALKEYKKAISISRELSFKDETKKASRLLFDLEKKIKAIELDFALETGENAEKIAGIISRALGAKPESHPPLKRLTCFPERSMIEIGG